MVLSTWGRKGRRKVAPCLGLFNLCLLLPGVAAAAPPAAPDDARGSLALYCAEECGDLQLPGFSLKTRLPGAATRPVVVLSDVTETWDRPDADALERWGEGDVAGMAEAGQVVLLQWAAPVHEGSARLDGVLAAAVDASDWLEDVDTGRLLGAAEADALAAAAAADDLDVSQVATVEVHEGKDGRLVLATRGLRRLGLPELVAAGLPADSLGPDAARVNAVAQAVYERGLSAQVVVDASTFASPTARAAACELKGQAVLDYHHGHTRLLGGGVRAGLVSFDGEFGSCPAGAATGAPTSPPLAPNDPAPEAPPDDLATVQAASLARLAGPVHDAWQAGLPAGERLMIKAPFQSAEGKVTWLWLGVQEWKADDVLVGQLLSRPPDGFGLAEGQQVQSRLDLVFDYLWQKADGTTEGNETQRFLD